MTRAAAFFDVDKTLIPGSSSMTLIGAFRREGLVDRRMLMRLVRANVVYKLHGTDDARLARWTEASTRLIAGWPRETVRRVVAEGLETKLLPIVYREALDLIATHRDRGDRVFAVSATMEDVIRPLAESLGLETIASEVVTGADGRYTGEISVACWGREKIERIGAIAARVGLDLAASSAYSDSISDLPMLAAVGHPVAVNPDRPLAEEAARRGWPIMAFRHPTRRARADRRRVTMPLAVAVAALIALGLRRSHRPA